MPRTRHPAGAETPDIPVRSLIQRMGGLELEPERFVVRPANMAPRSASVNDEAPARVRFMTAGRGATRVVLRSRIAESPLMTPDRPSVPSEYGEASLHALPRSHRDL
jgi:hypothetical protein